MHGGHRVFIHYNDHYNHLDATKKLLSLHYHEYYHKLVKNSDLCVTRCLKES